MFAIVPNLLIAATVALVNVSLFLLLLTAQTLKRALRKVSDCVENWLLEPVLLFSCIVFASMTVPTNAYIFSTENYDMLFAAVLQCLLAYGGGVGLGLGVGVCVCVDSSSARTLTSLFCAANTLPAILLLRWVLDPTMLPAGVVSGSAPDGHLGIIGPVWVLVAYPLPLILYYSARGLRRWFVAFVRKRREEQYRYAGAELSKISISISILDLHAFSLWPAIFLWLFSKNNKF